MLKRKLLGKLKSEPSSTIAGIVSMESNCNIYNNINSDNNSNHKSSPYFIPSFWEQFFALECCLNVALRTLTPPPEITHTYNPIEYAAQIHCAYLKSFLKGPKKLMLIGMNPGADGMAQNGVPFGNITTVRDVMHLYGMVFTPPQLHPKRPIKGLECTTEEPSGKRLWTVLQKLSNDSLDTFSQQCFVHNFCPLAFYDRQGKNITPSELKGSYKTQIRDVCLETTEQQLQLVQPDIILAVGDYVFRTLAKSEYCKSRRLLRLAHPSPRSLNNTNWPEKAELFFRDNDLLKYLRNEKK